MVFILFSIEISNRKKKNQKGYFPAFFEIIICHAPKLFSSSKLILIHSQPINVLKDMIEGNELKSISMRNKITVHEK